MATQPSAVSRLRNARGKALEAAAEIEEIIRMKADPGVMDLRVDWAVCELLCAITELRMAHVAAHQAVAAPVEIVGRRAA